MDIITAIDKVISVQQVLIIFILLLTNFVTGTLSGVMTKTLNWSKIGDISKRAGIMCGVYLIMCVPAYYLVNEYGQDWGALRTLALAGVTAFLVDKILINLKEMGLPLPAITSKDTNKPTSVLGALPGLKWFSSRMM